MLKRRMTKLLNNLTCFFSYDPFGWLLASFYNFLFLSGVEIGMSMFNKYRGITSYDAATWKIILSNSLDGLTIAVSALILIGLILYLAGSAVYPKYADNPYRKKRSLGDVVMTSVGLGALPFFGICVLAANTEQLYGIITPWELKQYIVLITLPAVLWLACLGQMIVLAYRSMQIYKQYRIDEWRFELININKEMKNE